MPMCRMWGLLCSRSVKSDEHVKVQAQQGMCICRYVCMYVCMCIRVYVCTCVCMCNSLVSRILKDIANSGNLASWVCTACRPSTFKLKGNTRQCTQAHAQELLIKFLLPLCRFACVPALKVHGTWYRHRGGISRHVSTFSHPVSSWASMQQCCISHLVILQKGNIFILAPVKPTGCRPEPRFFQ